GHAGRVVREIEALGRFVRPVGEVDGIERQRRRALDPHHVRLGEIGGAHAQAAISTNSADITKIATIVPTTPRVTAWGISVGPAVTARPWYEQNSATAPPKLMPLNTVIQMSFADSVASTMFA